MTHPTVLIVEDEIKIAELLSDYFRNDDFTVFRLNRGDLVVPFMGEQDCDLVLLDIMLPGMDGIEVCREIRTFSTVPIIMLTARVEEPDVLLGLGLGADDYICKPFSPREVVARAKAVMRRTFSERSRQEIETGLFSLNLQCHEVRVNHCLLNLTPNEYGILKAMISSPNKVFSRKQLVTLVQGYQFEGYNRTIDTHIKNIRKKIAVHLPGRDVIQSVYGTGYKFSPDPD